MPSFFNLSPILTAVQAVLLTVLLIMLVIFVLNDFVLSKSIVRGVTRIIVIGIAAFIIATPQAALEVGLWFVRTVGFG